MTDSIHAQMRPIDIFILIILSVLWGGSFFFIEVLVDYFPPLTIVNFRVGLAALLLWMIIIARRIPVPKKLSHWAALLILGAFNNALPFTLITWGQTEINSGLASILNATAPFFTIIIAGIFLADEKITRGKFLGVLLGLAGTAVMIGPEALGGLTGSVLGQFAVLGAAFSYAFAAVFARRFKRWGISPMIVATGQVTTAALMLLPLTLTLEQPWTLSPAPVLAWAALLALAILSTVLAYILYFRLIENAGATNASLVTFLIPISAILLGVFVLGEVFTGLQAAGMALIALGLLIMDGRLTARLISSKT